jgi:sarcosine oxidase gamma subunit
MGSFYDFARKAPRAKAEVVLTFRINGEIVDVAEEAEAPAIVKAARTIAKQTMDKVSKKK